MMHRVYSDIRHLNVISTCVPAAHRRCASRSKALARGIFLRCRQMYCVPTIRVSKSSHSSVLVLVYEMEIAASQRFLRQRG